MRHIAYRSALLAAIGGLAAAVSTPAVAQAPRTVESGCIVEHVDARGATVRTETAREGAVAGRFGCVQGRWQLAQSPFDRGDAVSAQVIRVDPAGAVTASRLVGPALGHDLTLAQVTRLAQALSGSAEAVVTRAVVIADDGRQRTPEQVRALLEGRDSTGARILGAVDRPDPAKSTGEIIGDVGGTPEGTVVYLSIWDAISDFFSWVVDTATDVIGWFDRHCNFEPAWNGGPGFDVTCRFS